MKKRIEKTLEDEVLEEMNLGARPSMGNKVENEVNSKKQLSPWDLVVNISILRGQTLAYTCAQSRRLSESKHDMYSFPFKAIIHIAT